MKEELKRLVDKLEATQELSFDEWTKLIESQSPELSEYIFAKARRIREEHYGKEVYTRGIVEFTNVCKNDCLYCGIRASNSNVNRYRLTKEEILECCMVGYELGYRTFVLQGGEDPYYTDDMICEIVSEIRAKYPDCAITLSIGEKSHESYQRYFEAGAERYLLRHETANEEHYAKLHTASQSCAERKACLYDLKKIGYQVGAGFMVGAPYQTAENLAEDMIFLKDLNPAMIGIGPFIPAHDTPFADMESGTLEQTLYMLGLLRLMLPKALIPSTTALGTIHPRGREMGMEAGANVVMPNLSPTDVRKDYMLYDNKICIGDAAVQCRHCIEMRMESVGYEVVSARGDSLNMDEN